ncbi:MAG: YggS family pyridoxal phosphate-dependent enzyme [Pontibacterium sp.]
MTDFAQNLSSIRYKIQDACQAAGRPSSHVNLLAVSKTKPAEQVRAVAALGQTHFGENYLQEALDKQAALADLDLVWHFIGPIQSNKTRPIAESFAWVHSVDRAKIAQRLSDQRPAHMPPLQVCIQVNISEEDSKSGCLPADVAKLASTIEALPNLNLRGLMAIPKATDNPVEQAAAFNKMQTLLTELKSQLADNKQLDTLSMGMSGDMGTAIAAGSTIVRIGTALFGARG